MTWSTAWNVWITIQRLLGNSSHCIGASGFWQWARLVEIGLSIEALLSAPSWLGKRRAHCKLPLCVVDTRMWHNLSLSPGERQLIILKSPILAPCADSGSGTNKWHNIGFTWANHAWQHLQNCALEFPKMPNISLAKFSTKQVQYYLCVCLTSGIVSGPSNRKPITFYRIMLVVEQDRVDDKGKTYV